MSELFKCPNCERMTSDSEDSDCDECVLYRMPITIDEDSFEWGDWEFGICVSFNKSERFGDRFKINVTSDRNAHIELNEAVVEKLVEFLTKILDGRDKR